MCVKAEQATVSCSSIHCLQRCIPVNLINVVKSFDVRRDAAVCCKDASNLSCIRTDTTHVYRVSVQQAHSAKVLTEILPLQPKSSVLSLTIDYKY
jgi:hypothetical protein